MPKNVRFHKLGGPENLQIEEVPSQQPGNGEVLLQVQAVGLNRADAMFYRGNFLVQPTLPSGLAYEASGIVDAVGPDVDQSWIGKQVSTLPAFVLGQYGVLGQEAIVPVTALGEYPTNQLSPSEGAAIWMQYLTAWNGLIHIGHLTKGDFVLITAASSSVGVAAIQIVKDAGGVAIATTRTSKKREELLSLGADHVIATDEEDLVARVKEITGGKGARIVYDSISGPFIEKLVEAAANGGILIMIGALSHQPTPFPLFPVMAKGLTIRGSTVWEITIQQTEVLEVAKKFIYDRLADGRFIPKIAKAFPYSQTVEAYQYLESNEQIGKVIINVS